MQTDDFNKSSKICIYILFIISHVSHILLDILLKPPSSLTLLVKEVRYNKKPVHEISLNFPEMFIIGIYVKIRFKSRESLHYFLSSRGQKIKKIQKLNKRHCFCLHFWFHFLWHFSHKD